MHHPFSQASRFPSRELTEASGADYPNVDLIVVFDALNLFAVVTLSVIFCTAWFSPQIRRVSTWFLYIFSWDVFSLGYLLILGHQTDSLPGPGICLFQAMMIYATPAFAATSIVVFVLQIFLDIKYALVLEFLHKDQVKKLVAVPFVVFFAILSEVLILGLTFPDTVERDPSRMFCHLSTPLSSMITGAIVLVCIIIILVLGVLITTAIRRNRDTWKNIRSREPHPFDLVFRISLFVLAPVIATGLVLLAFLPPSLIDFAKVNVVYAILPATAAMIFSSQRDILRVWMFWRSSSKISEHTAA